MNSLNDAASYCVPLFTTLVENCAKVKVPVRIVDIARTPIQQTIKIKTGVSWTQNSKHLPQPPENKSEAIDVVPLSILQENKPDWDPTHPDWQAIGEVGRKLGLEWGGDWKEHKDPSHFQYIHKPDEGQRPGVIQA